MIRRKVNWSNGRFRNGVVERSSVAGSQVAGDDLIGDTVATSWIRWSMSLKDL